MADRFDDMMRDVAFAADAKVDYAAMRQAILEKAVTEKTVTKHKRRAALYRNLSVAAALVLLGGGTGYLMGSTGLFASNNASAADATAGENGTPYGVYSESALLGNADGGAGDYILMDNPTIEVPKTDDDGLSRTVTGGTGEAEDQTEAEAEESLQVPQTDPAMAMMLADESDSLQDYAAYMFRQFTTTLVNRTHTLEPDYEPATLVDIKSYNQSGNLTIKRSKCYGDLTAVMALNEMMKAAAEEGVKGFNLASAYRTYEYQKELWDAKVAADPTYGADPEEPIITAYPGTSEHHTGLAFDITAVQASSMVESFALTEQGKWLAENSYRFGFILRYPKGKEHITGIVYEPWHFRYVGVELATYLYENDLVLEEFYEGF